MLGHRSWTHGLDRRPGGVDAVLGLGVQDTPYGSAARALAARGATPADTAATALVWTWRGAPHLHRTADLALLARALWPVSDADATKRILTPSIREGARRGIAAFTAAATAMREVVGERMPKGEVSRLVSARVPEDLTYDCAPCGARHISGALFQQVGLAAGVRVVPQGRSTFLEPLPGDVRPEVPARTAGAGEALLRYVELHGPASAAHLASFLGTTASVAKGLVPDGLVEVAGPGGRGFLAAAALDRARAAEPLRATRLLPPSDPWLQARDREVVVPDPARRAVVWRALGNPGVVLVDGEVAGTWRAAAGRAGRVRVAVEEFATLPPPVREEVEAEARRLADERGAPAAVEVAFGG